MSGLPDPPSASAAGGYFQPGSVLADRYRIEGEVGRGGYSIVYRGVDLTLETTVAIKLLVPPPSVAQVARERMRREALAARGLSHPNIVTLHDFQEESGHSFLVMEFVDGPDLAQRVRELGILPALSAAGIARDIAAALEVAHAGGVLHRDVKPQNVLLGSDGRARLADFGSARITDMETVTRTGGLVGTVAYTSPEVMAGQRGDARSDLYALGMLLFYTLTGELPQRPSPHLPPTPLPAGHRPRDLQPEIPGWLDEITAGLTRTDPGQRYPTAGALLDALDRGIRGDPPSSAAPLSEDFSETGMGRPGNCLVCGGEDPFGLGLCPDCASSGADRSNPAGRAGERLLFVERPRNRREQREVTEYLSDLVGDRRLQAEIEATARGELPLARLPTDVAEPASRRLRKVGVPVRIAHPLRFGARVTPVFGLVLGIALGMGFLAGFRAAPLMLLVTPVFATAMVWFALRRQRNPLLRAASVSSLPAASERRVRQAITALPDGPARRLLGDFVRMARGFQTQTGDGEDLTTPVAALLDHACDAATDLASLDQNLSILEGQRGRAPEGSWLDALTQASRTRDQLVQKLLEALAVMGRARATGSGLPGRAADHLTELAAELDDEVTWRAEAKRQVEAALASA